MTGSARIWALLALPVTLAGCAGGQAATRAPASPAASAAAAGPPETALMICNDDIRSKVQQLLDLPGAPHTTATWADSVYTCTFDLPMGPMTLRVRVLPGDAQAAARLDTDRKATAGARPLAGLGERAWDTPAGTVAALKDNQILTVDTTRLPAVLGPGEQRRGDLADEVAAAVMGCWTGVG
jgi:hypothetical protein